METAQISTGVLAPTAVLVTFGVSAALSPVYSWPTDPFSVIGATGNLAAAFFNTGLVVAGLLSIPFAVRLWTFGNASAGVLYGLVGLSFAGAGLFPIGAEANLHELFGVGIFLGIWLLLWTAGVGDWRSGHRREGLIAFALGSIAVSVWLPYDFGLTWAQVGYGAAELVAVLSFAAWSARTAARLRKRSADQTTGGTTEEGVGA